MLIAWMKWSIPDAFQVLTEVTDTLFALNMSKKELYLSMIKNLEELIHSAGIANLPLSNSLTATI
jgi:hypothetical protein